MNAKKIMGAVLVALLAAALFVGAGAADDKGSYFVYQENEGLKTSMEPGPTEQQASLLKSTTRPKV